jgi:hypothetical protein
MGEPAQEGTMSAKKATQKSAKSTTATGKKSEGFTDEERAAMKERAQELKAEARRGPRADKAGGESDLLAKIAEMPEPDRAMGKRLHEIIKVRDARLQRQGEPRRRRHVADLLRAEGVDCHRRGKDRRAREESGELSQLLSPAPRLVTTIAKENQTYCSKLVRSSQGDPDADREGGPA